MCNWGTSNDGELERERNTIVNRGVGEEGIQEQLEGAKRNKHVYENIASELQKKDIDKTGEQSRANMKKLKLDYMC